MLSLEQIVYENNRAAQEAAKKGKFPYTPLQREIATYPPFPFPYLGNYVPDGWELIDHVLVDSSGFGQPWELALTAEGFKYWLEVQLSNKPENKTIGFAIIECGEFQVVIGKFYREVVS